MVRVIKKLRWKKQCGEAILIGPSILNADLSQLAVECERLIQSGADYLHLDVMDGHFVPNITFGPPVVKCLRNKVPNISFDMHMMVSHPQNWIETMSQAGAQLFTFHLEACDDVMTCIRKVRESGMQVGLAIKPNSRVDDLLPFISAIDVALVMTVEPGFGGQAFKSDMIEKIRYLRQNYPTLDIEVDGGINLETVKSCYEAGANLIVAGTSIIESNDPQHTIACMKNYKL